MSNPKVKLQACILRVYDSPMVGLTVMMISIMQCNAMPSLLALVGVHALIHHHDADTSQIFASPASTPTHLDVLPTLHPPVPPHTLGHHTRNAAQL